MATTSSSSPLKVVAYHYPCPDGIFGALAAYLHFHARGKLGQVRWLPMTVTSSVESRVAALTAALATTTTTTTTTPPAADNTTTLYLVDFTGGSAFIESAVKMVKSVIVIDHHKTAAEDLASPSLSSCLNLDTKWVRMDMSGATLARDYFQITAESILNHPVINGSQEDASAVMLLFRYIEDNDLWKHVLESSKNFTAAFAALQLDMDAAKNPGIFDTLLTLRADKLIAQGKLLEEEQDRIINGELENVFPIAIPYPTPSTASSAATTAGGSAAEPSSATTSFFRVLAVITTHPDFRSTQGNRLAKMSSDRGAAAAAAGAAGDAAAAALPFHPSGAVVYVDDAIMSGEQVQTSYKVSLRSIGDCDTTVVSKAYGGGGHKNASSFVVGKEVFLSWKVEA